MDITTDIIIAFRNTHKAFGDLVKWPDEIVEMALCEALTETGSSRWGAYGTECTNFKQRGMFYFAAHWLSSFYGSTAADPTKVDANARLNLSGKSVGDESIQFRITAIQETGPDWLSTTIYGTQFYRLLRRAGMGAVAV